MLVFLILIGFFVFTANDWQFPWLEEVDHSADWCKAHQVELSVCDKCNIDLVRGGTVVIREREPKEGECPNTLMRITLAPDVAEQINLQLHAVESHNISETIIANAETQYVPTKYTRIAPRISGVIREVKSILGDEVEEGTVLALVESVAFSQAKSEYLQAIAIEKLRQQAHEREKNLVEQKIGRLREVQEAHTALIEAQIALERTTQKLLTLGLSSEQIKIINTTKDTSGFLEVKAPFDGIIVESSAVPGETATPEKAIFAIADMDRLWLTIDVYEADIAKITKGQRVVFTMESILGRRFPGKIVTIGGEVNERTRTIPVWADIKNPQHLLRSKMFGQATITVKTAEPKLLIHKDAVQSDNDCNLVFVSAVNNIFQSRKIEIGCIYEGGYEVTSGLSIGEKVVTTGSFLLKTEILRGQMGAG